jgi:hypothetical protein
VRKVIIGLFIVAAIVGIGLGGYMYQQRHRPIPLASTFDGKIDGVWVWEVHEEQTLPKAMGQARPTGTLIMKNEQGIVSGMSVVELPVKDNADKVSKVLIRKSFYGGVKKHDKDSIVMDFTIDDVAGKTDNHAVIDTKTGVMTGTSLFSSNKKDVPTFGYKWIGRKMVLSN